MTSAPGFGRPPSSSTNEAAGFLRPTKRWRSATAGRPRPRRRPGWRAAPSGGRSRNCRAGPIRSDRVSAAPVAGASARWRRSRARRRRSRRWSRTRSVVIRRRRCAGSAAASARSPGRSSAAASGPARSWWAGYCASWATAARPTARPGRGQATPTAMPSSATSTPSCRRRWRQVSQPSRWIPKRRSSSATSRTPAANCGRSTGPSRCGCTTSSCPSWARSRPTASTTSPPMRDGSASE